MDAAAFKNGKKINCGHFSSGLKSDGICHSVHGKFCMSLLDAEAIAGFTSQYEIGTLASKNSFDVVLPVQDGCLWVFKAVAVESEQLGFASRILGVSFLSIGRIANFSKELCCVMGDDPKPYLRIGIPVLPLDTLYCGTTVAYVLQASDVGRHEFVNVLCDSQGFFQNLSLDMNKSKPPNYPSVATWYEPANPGADIKRAIEYASDKIRKATGIPEMVPYSTILNGCNTYSAFNSTAETAKAEGRDGKCLGYEGDLNAQATVCDRCKLPFTETGPRNVLVVHGPNLTLCEVCFDNETNR